MMGIWKSDGKRVTALCVAGETRRDIPLWLMKRRKSFCVTSAILSKAFQKITLSFRGSRSTLEVSCCVVFANRTGSAASSADNVQMSWQAWYMVSLFLFVHFTLHALHSTLYTPQTTLHTLLYTPHSTHSTP